MNRRNFLDLGLAGLAAGAAGALLPSVALAQSALPVKGVAPEITEGGPWFNSAAPQTLEKLRGKVVLVNFWTFACINCQHTLPHVRALYQKYHNQGFEILGVHTPELVFERDLGNVQAAIKKESITWPVVFDGQYKVWNSYDNQFWPAFYYIDKKGRIRYTHFGEGEYATQDDVVKQLLAEA
ncbi:redoxin family protein [Amphibiibacter pelophylacis]|uniref:Redoxin domain-containing protein n=1 Tax=Amphibiibacter pelophylacis TaxID=1799477 RepID=A0ACC6NZK9_9BURK